MVCCGWIPISWEAAMAAAEHTKREALPQLSSTHCTKRREKKKMRRLYTEIVICCRQECLSFTENLEISHTQDSPLCCVFDLHPTTTADDDGADLEKAPLHFHAPKWATQATATLSD
jgi:hypothetical protein